MKRVRLLIFLLGLCAGMSAQEWAKQELPGLEGRWKLIDIDMVSPSSGWAAGNYYATEGTWRGGTAGLILRFDGTSWKSVALPPVEGHWWLRSLCFLSENEGWAVGSDGEQGLILHFAQGKWSREILPEIAQKEWDLYGIYMLSGGEGWAVGGAGQKGAILLQRTGGHWILADLPDLLNKHTLVCVNGSSATDVWAGGFREGEFGKVMMTGQPWGSFLLHYDGKAWSEAEFPLLMRNIIMMDLQAFNEKEAIFAGYNPPFQSARENGKIAVWNGKKWSDAKPPDAAHEWKLYDLAMKDPANGYAAGEYLQRRQGLVLQCTKGTWEVIKEKKLPQVSTQWDLVATDFDGGKAWYFAGWDAANHQGIIYRLTE
ncbi:MAG TPA: hypothetical protein P5550_02225 [Bacteroidales bacterium]|nr:hypothetical protein [Bacteroidales bacterium]